MAHVYPTNEEQSLPEVHETLAVYGSTPRYAPTMQMEGTDRLRQRFDRHYNRWVAAPHLLLGYPLSHKWHTYKDYQAIIDMGRDAVPFILAQIKNHNFMLMHLLTELTHENVIVSANASEEETAKAWIQHFN